MKKILKAEFDCEVITPMFIGGANPRGNPEIRPPSIRGAMRWWFRAMMGGIIGNNITCLRKCEEYVFGSSEKASSVNIKTFGNLTWKEYPRLPHKNGEASAIRKAFDPNKYFKIVISVAPYVKKDEEIIFNCAKYSLLLLLSFGGVGTRSRRGYGSFTCISDEAKYSNLLREAKKCFENLTEKLEINKGEWDNIPSFPCISKRYFKLWSSSNNNEWEATLSNLMTKMSDFVANSESRNAIGGVHHNKRQASPLIIHAVKNKGNKIKLLFSHFYTSQNNPFSINDDNRKDLEQYIVEEFQLKEVEVFK